MPLHTNSETEKKNIYEKEQNAATLTHGKTEKNVFTAKLDLFLILNGAFPATTPANRVVTNQMQFFFVQKKMKKQKKKMNSALYNLL